MKRFYAIAFVYLMVAIIIFSVPTTGLNIVGAIWQGEVNPGVKANYEINISTGSNDMPSNFTVKVAGLEQTIQGFNAPASEKNDTSPYTARPFLTATPTSFHLEPGHSQVIQVEANIPSNVGSGGLYAIISLRSGGNSASSAGNSGGSNVGVSIGSDIPVVLTIANSELKRTGEITDLKVSEPISAIQQNVSVIFKNTGNIHYKAKAKAELKDEKGNSLVQTETPIGISPIMPTFSRLFELSLKPSSKLEPGTYNLTATVEKEDGTILDSKTTKLNV